MKEWVMGYLGALGVGGLFLGVIIEALGIPFPGGLMVILAGFLVNKGKFDFFSAFFATLIGFNIGSIIAYFISRHFGEQFLERFGRFLRVTPQRIQRAQDWLEKSAAVFIIFGRFVPMISNLTPYIAGISGLSILKFIIYNFIFTVIWSSFNLSLGFFFGHSWGYLLQGVRSWLPLFAGGILLALIIIIYLKRTHHIKF